MEDYLLIKKVDTARIEKLAKFSKEKNLGCLRLYASPEADLPINNQKLKENIGEVAIGAQYRVSLQAAIWCKKTLYDLILPGESAWDLEIYGSRRADLCPKPFYSLFGPAQETSPLPYFCTAVEKGEWIQGAIDLCKSENIPIDLSARPIEPFIQAKMRDLKLNKLIPRYRELRKNGFLRMPFLIAKVIAKKIKHYFFTKK